MISSGNNHTDESFWDETASLLITAAGQAQYSILEALQDPECIPRTNKHQEYLYSTVQALSQQARFLVRLHIVQKGIIDG